MHETNFPPQVASKYNSRSQLAVKDLINWLFHAFFPFQYTPRQPKFRKPMLLPPSKTISTIYPRSHTLFTHHLLLSHTNSRSCRLSERAPRTSPAIGETQDTSTPPIPTLAMRRPQNYHRSRYPLGCEGLGTAVLQRTHISTGSGSDGRSVRGLMMQAHEANDLVE